MQRQWLLGIIAAAGFAAAQTQVDLGKQSKDVDFSQAPSTRPFKSGTTLPSTCAVGQMFYLTNGPAGANVYGCTAANTWTPEGAGNGAQSADQLTDLQPVRSSSTVLTIGQNCSSQTPCNVALNGVTYAFASAMTVTNSSSSGLTVRGYVSDGSDGQSAGTFVIASTGASGLTCSGGCVVLNTVSAFPVSAGIVTEFSWTATGVNGQWDVAGYTDWRPFQGGGDRLFSTNGNCTVSQSAAGTGLTCAGVSLSWSNIQNPTATTSFNMGPYATSFSWTDPSLGDPNDHYGMSFTCVYDANDTANNNFSDDNCLQPTLNFNFGQALYGNGTNAKRTAIVDSRTMNAAGAGQRILEANTLNCYGVSDCAKESSAITCAGGPVAGDETSCGFNVISYVKQQPNLVKTTVTSTPSRSGCPGNMTLTQAVTASTTAQTVSVSSTSGCAVNDWLIADWAGPTGYANYDPIQIAAIGAGTITARFTANHSSGATLRSGVAFTVNSTSQFGQNRVLVDESGASYSTGTVAFANGSAAITGTGTNWSTAMVGGDSASPGCIEATAEDQTYSPFGTGASALHSWWELAAVNSATSANIFSFSIAGTATYNGKSFSGSSYSIRPCGRILMISGNTIVLSPNTSAWSNGDTVELAITPYIDSTQFQYQVGMYTPGGTYRGFEYITNNGGQPLNSVFTAANSMTGNNTSSDRPAWSSFLNGVSNASNPVVDWIIDFGGANIKSGAFRLPGPFAAGDPGGIAWFQSNASVSVIPNGSSYGTTGSLIACGLGGGNPPYDCLYGFNLQTNEPGAIFQGGGLEVANSARNAQDVFFTLRAFDSGSPSVTTAQLLLNSTTTSNFPGRQYEANGDGFIGQYTNFNLSGLEPMFLWGYNTSPGSSQLGQYLLPQAVATNGTNYASFHLGVGASIWNGSGESPVWSFWDLEPDTNATNASSHAKLYGPCSGTITNACQYLSAGLDGLTVAGPATADYWTSTLGTAMASAATIAPAKYITHVTGTTAISTITPPPACASAGKSCVVVLIPDAANVYNTSGNIANALTATVNVPVVAVYDNSTAKWYLK